MIVAQIQQLPWGCCNVCRLEQHTSIRSAGLGLLAHPAVPSPLLAHPQDPHNISGWGRQEQVVYSWHVSFVQGIPLCKGNPQTAV